MIEQRQADPLPFRYLPISPVLAEFVKAKSNEQLNKLTDVPVGVLFMISQGLAKQLREDVFISLSQALTGGVPDGT